MGNKPHKLCSNSPEPRAEVYCLRLNFNVSKLFYWAGFPINPIHCYAYSSLFNWAIAETILFLSEFCFLACVLLPCLSPQFAFYFMGTALNMYIMCLFLLQNDYFKAFFYAAFVPPFRLNFNMPSCCHAIRLHFGFFLCEASTTS